MKKVLLFLFLACLFLLPQTALAGVQYKLFLEEGLKIEFTTGNQNYEQGTILGVQFKGAGRFTWQTALAWTIYDHDLLPRASLGVSCKPLFKRLPKLSLDGGGVYQYDFINHQSFVGSLLTPIYAINETYDLALIIIGGRYWADGPWVLSVTHNLIVSLPF